MTSIDLGNVIEIGYYAFMNCTSLTSVDLGNIIEIECSAFRGCTGLTSVNLGNATYIGGTTFWGCTGLTSIDLKNVTEIGYCAFLGCTGLTSVDLKNVTNIGSEAFIGCKDITEVRTSEKEAPSIGDSFGQYTKELFEAITYNFATLYIPAGSMKSYKDHEIWGNFIDIKEYKVNENDIILSVNCNHGGEVSFKGLNVSNNCKSIELKKGEKVKLTITPFKGYRLKSFKIDGKDMTSELNNNFYTFTIENDTYVNVQFVKLPVMLTIRYADNGDISQQVIEGNSYYFTINAAENWKINTVTFNDINVTSDLDQNNGYTTPPIYENSVLNVTFESENTAITDVLSGDVSVRGYNGEIIIEGTEYGDIIQIYTPEGSVITSEVSNGNDIKVVVDSGNVYIIKVGNRTFKLAI